MRNTDGRRNRGEERKSAQGKCKKGDGQIETPRQTDIQITNRHTNDKQTDIQTYRWINKKTFSKKMTIYGMR